MLGVADARELALEAQRRIAKGGDPAVEECESRDVVMLEELATEYIERHTKPKKRRTLLVW